MDPLFWHESWHEGRTGFHQQAVHDCLQRHWPKLTENSSVLVPMCGKSLDMLWLEDQGLTVTGVELVEQAAEAFCHENGLACSVSLEDGRKHYQLIDSNIRLVVDDFFHFARHYRGRPFDSLYDRAALVALPPELRRKYVSACKSLLSPCHDGLLVTLEYEQALMDGPPFSVTANEVQRHWAGRVACIERRNALDTLPKAKEHAIARLDESCWKFVCHGVASRQASET
ncbi:MAG: thiopurine S-methyltransferase [Xanthomonadales bacterium]|nr:thiopurine S-methyltransferase [Xanthomonadales bacterium]